MSAAAAPTSRYKTDIYLVYTRYIPYPGYIPCLYMVYPCHIHSKGIYMVYTRYISGIDMSFIRL